MTASQRRPVWFDNVLDWISKLSCGLDKMLARPGKVLGWIALFLILVTPVARAIWSDWNAPPPTPAEQAARRELEIRLAKERRDNIEFRRFLCQAASACKRYSEARLECATAGNFKTCLRIKMGDDASYSDMCSGYDEGAPAVPLPPETPN